jgi:lipopolysaccharide biosynthesis glycosyltransferase
MIHIALSLHDKQGNYWPYVVTTLTSVFTHSSRALHVHVLHDDTLREEARRTIETLCDKFDQQLSLHHVTLPSHVQAIDFGQFSPAAAYRLMLPQLLKHLDLVIYLDADIIFNQVDIADLEAVIQSDAQQHPLAAVHDRLFSCHASQRRELANIGISANEYINSGVLGLRPKLIGADLLDELQRFAHEHPHAQHHDQDLLNVLFKQQIFRLPERFNFQVNLTQGRCFEDLGYYANQVLHFSGKAKPLSGTLSPADVFFWRYTQHVPNIHRFVKAPIRYLQQMRDKPSAANLIATQEGPAPTAPVVQWLTTDQSHSTLAWVAKDPRITLCNGMTWEASQAAVREGKASGTVWSAPHLQVNDFHLAARMHEWWQHDTRCVLRDADGQALLVAQYGVSDEPLSHILDNAPGNFDATWDVSDYNSTQTQPSPLLIVTATRESSERFFTHTELGKSITHLRSKGVNLKVHAATSNTKAIGAVYNSAIDDRWAHHIIVFVHDDVRINDRYIAHHLHEALNSYDVVGVVGDRRRYFGQPAWHRPQVLSQPGPKHDLMGSIFHDTTNSPNTKRVVQDLSRFGDCPGAAQLLDGVFLAARGRTLIKQAVRFDAALGFDFYDLDFCRSATQANLRLGVWPIALTHMSLGGYESPSWKAAYKKYLAKWGEEAPQKFV